MKQSDSLLYPCNLPSTPPYKYRNIKNGDDAFNMFHRTPLNLYRARYIDSLALSDSDPCSGYIYTRRDLSDSLFM